MNNLTEGWEDHTCPRESCPRSRRDPGHLSQNNMNLNTHTHKQTLTTWDKLQTIQSQLGS